MHTSTSLPAFLRLSLVSFFLASILLVTAQDNVESFVPDSAGDEPSGEIGTRLVSVTASHPIRNEAFSVDDLIDHRVRVQDTAREPWNRVVDIEATFPGPIWEDCTGWLIGPRLVATAAHCIYLRDHVEGWATSVNIIAGRDGTNMPYGVIEAQSWDVRSEYADKSLNPQEAPLYDYGIITLPDDTLGNQVGWFEYGVFNAESLLNQRAYTAGYPTDKWDAACVWPFTGCEQWSEDDPITRIEGDRIFYSLFLVKGASGSPVWLELADGSRRVFSITTHADSPPYGSSGIRITRDVAQWFQRHGAPTPKNVDSRVYLPLTSKGASTPSDMIIVPAGTFRMGCDPTHNGGYASCFSDELPLHTVYLNAYRIDRTEVSNAQYAQCVASGGCTLPDANSSRTRASYYDNPTYANHPVMKVSWDQADAYCRWAGKRLPTEAEWEKAARGGSITRAFPWGDAAASCGLANYTVSGKYCVGDSSAVDSYPAGASPYGALNMAGNVGEWVSDWYSGSYYSVSPGSNPRGPATGTYKVMRGGHWAFYVYGLRVAYRNMPLQPSTQMDIVGFRCAGPTAP